jgi:excinuclease ABC subunit C
VPLAQQAPETLLIGALRDEAHRFAITYHRQRRGRIASELDDVPGVGPLRRKSMLRHFGSLSALRMASRDQLRAMPGLPRAVADAVFERMRSGAGPTPQH